MALLRNSVATPFPPGPLALEFQSQRDGMCESADWRRSCDRLRPGIPRQRRGLAAFSTTDKHAGNTDLEAEAIWTGISKPRPGR